MANLHATLYRVDRTAERLPVERASTLRGPDGIPIDATIENLSTTGCRLALPHAMNVDEIVMIGLAGVGIRRAQVIWSDAGQTGCAFEKPLSTAEVQQVQSAQTVERGRFPSLPTPPPVYEPDTSETPRGLSARARLGIIVTLAAVSWLAIGGLIAAAYLIFAG